MYTITEHFEKIHKICTHKYDGRMNGQNGAATGPAVTLGDTGKNAIRYV
jgi:hypothetical protein